MTLFQLDTVYISSNFEGQGRRSQFVVVGENVTKVVGVTLSGGFLVIHAANEAHRSLLIPTFLTLSQKTPPCTSLLVLPP